MPVYTVVYEIPGDYWGKQEACRDEVHLRNHKRVQRTVLFIVVVHIIRYGIRDDVPLYHRKDSGRNIL